MFFSRRMLIGMLRSQGYLPYRHLSDAAMGQLEDAVRVIELEAGERLTLTARPSWRCFSLLSGQAALEQGESTRPLGIESTRQFPLKLEPGTTGTLLAQQHCVLCIGDSDALDHLIAWDTVGDSLDTGDAVLQQRFSRVRHCVTLRNLPIDRVIEALRRMQPQNVEAGSEVVRQGAPGDAFYLIETGSADVWQTGLYDDEPQCVAHLGPGDAFGDEALVTGGTRNATVRMTSDGSLLTLAREDFLHLVSQPLIAEISAEEARQRLQAGQHLLDVRYAEEFEDNHIPGAILIPLPELRARASELDATQPHVVYCRSGKRSAVASLLLRQRNIEAVSLQGGLQAWPFEQTAPPDA